MKFRIIKDKIGFSSEYFLPRQGWNSIFDDNLMDIKSPTYDDILWEINNFSKNWHISVENR
ncbi:hypothetical protein M0Q97_09700 [Candidatus Dojkabacteria bacterium]|jgi:hypothetical protein|nr:hypothetical protein [Candidatus Dojkabacteria bacterium]